MGLTGPEGRQGAVLVQPGEGGAAQLLQTGCGHHAVVRLEQRLNDDAELQWG